MKYQINDTIVINKIEWIVTEHRMARGREWVYLLSHKDIDGNHITMSLNERAMDGVTLKTEIIGSIDNG